MLPEGQAIPAADDEIPEFRIIRQSVTVISGAEPGSGMFFTVQVLVTFLGGGKILPCANGIDPAVLHAFTLQIVTGCDQSTEIVIVVGEILNAVAISLQLQTGP